MKKRYYIICLEQKSNEDTLLFWRPKSLGYTSSFESAGRFDKDVANNINAQGRDIALTIEELKEITTFKKYTVINCSFNALKELKEKVRINKQ